MEIQLQPDAISSFKQRYLLESKWIAEHLGIEWSCREEGSRRFATPLHLLCNVRLLRFGESMERIRKALGKYAMRPLGPIVHLLEPVPHLFPHVSMGWNGKNTSLDARDELVIITRRPIELEGRLLDAWGYECSPFRDDIQESIEFELRAYTTPQKGDASYDLQDTLYWTNSNALETKGGLFQELTVRPIESNDYGTMCTAAPNLDAIEVDPKLGRFKLRKQSRYRLRFRFAMVSEGATYTIVAYPLCATPYSQIEHGKYQRSVQSSLTAVCPQVVVRVRAPSSKESASCLPTVRIASRKRTRTPLHTHAVNHPPREDPFLSWPVVHSILIKQLSRLELNKLNLYELAGGTVPKIKHEQVQLLPLHGDDWLGSTIECEHDTTPGRLVHRDICFEFCLTYSNGIEIAPLSNEALHLLDSHSNAEDTSCSFPLEVCIEREVPGQTTSNLLPSSYLLPRANICETASGKHFFRVLPDGVARIRFSMSSSTALLDIQRTSTPSRCCIVVRPLLERHQTLFNRMVWRSQTFVPLNTWSDAAKRTSS